MIKILLPLLLAFPLSAFAEEIIVVPKTIEEEKPSSPADAEHTSPKNREDKYVTWDYQLIGVGPSQTIDNGFSVGYFLNSNMALLFNFGQGREIPDLVDSLFGEETDIHSRYYGIHFKHFVGNSFYYRLGVDYRTVKYNVSVHPIFNPTERGSFDARSTAIYAGIGSQWQWENFTLGCDWVGVSLPVARDVRSEISTGTSAQNELQEDRDDLTKKPALNLLRFYLGASF